MEAHEAVTAANEAFYRAFETLNVKEMEKVWLQADHIKCVHPSWPLLCGWDPIMSSWERIFTSAQSMRFSLSDVRLEVSGTLGWAVLIENLDTHGPDGVSRSQILTTNLFEQHDGQWLMVHHHASPIFTPPTPAEGQLH